MWTSYGVELRAPAQERQLDQEPAARDHGARALGPARHSAARRAARGQQVVVQQHPRAVGQRVGVHLQRVDAVLEDVLGRHGLPRQLPGLAGGDEADPQLPRHRRAEDEPARLGGDDEVHAQRPRPLGHPRDRSVQRRRDRAAAA